MKKSQIVHCVFTACLIFGLIISTQYPSRASGDAKGHIVGTLCCNGSTWTGNSNDCASGGGSCVDHYCGYNETETAASSCGY